MIGRAGTAGSLPVPLGEVRSSPTRQYRVWVAADPAGSLGQIRDFRIRGAERGDETKGIKKKDKLNKMEDKTQKVMIGCHFRQCTFAHYCMEEERKRTGAGKHWFPAPGNATPQRHTKVGADRLTEPSRACVYSNCEATVPDLTLKCLARAEGCVRSVHRLLAGSRVLSSYWSLTDDLPVLWVEVS